MKDHILQRCFSCQRNLLGIKLRETCTYCKKDCIDHKIERKCRCGSSNHKKTNHSSCPLNKKNYNPFDFR